MSGEFTVKRNCAQSGVPYLTFDGLTDDSMCFEYLASSALLTPKQVYSTACKDYYVQGGDGKKTVSSYDICNAADKPNDQVKIVDHLKEIKSHTFSSEMHRLSEALAPLAIAATELREQEGYKWRRFEYINSEISTAKKALCINDGYKKKTDDDGHVANAYNECREEDSRFWKNLWRRF